MNDQLIKMIIDYFQNDLNIIALYLFGSQVQGAHSESDIDLALLFHPNKVPDALSLFNKRTELADQLQQDVDIVCLNTADPIIGTQVLQNHLTLIERPCRFLDE